MSKSLLVFELSVDHAGHELELVISIPGRQGTASKVWKGTQHTLLTAAQLDDIRAYVDHRLAQYLLVAVGAQQSLL